MNRERKRILTTFLFACAFMFFGMALGFWPLIALGAVATVISVLLVIAY